MVKETIIISLGGSLVAPNKIDIGFLKNFRHCLSRLLEGNRGSSTKSGQKYQFFILVGGGKICRNYQKALLEFGAKSADRDWMGINVSKLNAEIVRQLFSGYSYEKIITDPNKKVKTSKDIIDYVYDKNPSQFSDAKPLKEIDWKSFKHIVGDKWTPGLSMPFDPKASKLAERFKLKVAIINGKYLERLEDFLNNKPFVGTIIR